jgi:hypothetical protein
VSNEIATANFDEIFQNGTIDANNETSDKAKITLVLYFENEVNRQKIASKARLIIEI